MLKLVIQDIRPSSLVVSWQSHNISDIYGFKVEYHAISESDCTSNSSVSNPHVPSLGPIARLFMESIIFEVMAKYSSKGLTKWPRGD